MGKYIRAECYKVFHRRYTWIFLLVMLVLEALLVAGWVFTNANGNNVGFSGGVGIMASMLVAGLYCTVLTGDMVFSDQYKSGTLKNEVSYGVPRTTIYLGKLAVECIVAVILCAVMVAFYAALCWVFLPHSPEADGMVMELVGYSLLCALPLWLGCQALSNMCMFLFKSSTVASFVVIGVVMALPEVLKLLALLVSEAFYAIRGVTLAAPFDVIANSMGDWGLFARCLLIGLGWFVGTTVLGAVVFRKREIN